MIVYLGYLQFHSNKIFIKAKIVEDMTHIIE